MQLSEGDIRCDVCAIRIYADDAMKTIETGTKTFHVHIGSTIPGVRESCSERAALLGWGE